jgi:hypothetical protein
LPALEVSEQDADPSLRRGADAALGTTRADVLSMKQFRALLAFVVGVAALVAAGCDDGDESAPGGSTEGGKGSVAGGAGRASAPGGKGNAAGAAGRGSAQGGKGNVAGGAGRDAGGAGGEAGGDAGVGGASGDAGAGGAGGEGALPACHAVNFDVSHCDPSVATFSLGSTNAYYPLIAGSVVELAGVGEGDEAGINITVRREVLDETRMIMGVETHVLRHETRFDGVLHEVALNFYVEATDGTVCYFGEDVEFYDDLGMFESTDGTWRAGEDGALPGVIMPANPEPGHAYYQELAPGIALDMGRITANDLTTTIGTESYATIQIMDTNPIDDEEPCGEEEKRYALGIGEVKDTVLEVVSFTP